MPKRNREIRPPCFVEVLDIKDLARLACAIERAPLPVFAMPRDNNFLLSVQFDMFMGRPIFYCSNSSEKKQYLGYRNNASVEEAVLTDSATSTTFVYAPVIAVKKLPASFEKSIKNPVKVREKFISLEVADLPSIAKISSYKMLFEEPPLPLYAFPIGDKYAVGSFARIDDYEEASLFFFAKLDKWPSGNFLKYSMQKNEETMFTNRIEEHGYVFIKVIRLPKKHPLVDL